jgi:alanine racemase
MHRGAVAKIDLGAVKHNLKVVRTYASKSAVYAVVKADSYGHGAVEVSKALIDAGTDRLVVAFCNEAAPLREAGIRKPIIVLFDPDPEDVFKYNLIPVVSNLQSAEHLSTAARAKGVKLPVHIKVDTGMGRLGFSGSPEKSILEIATLEGITVEGIMSHLSESEASDQEFSMSQISQLVSLRLSLEQKGLIVPYYHMANSGGISRIPEAHFDAVRPGLMLYGFGPEEKCGSDPAQKAEAEGLALKPVMSLTARIISLRKVSAGAPVSYNRTFITKRDSLIGAVAIGYADGYNVAFSNKSEMLVRNRRVPVVGRVCMDVTMVDLTDVADVNEHDEIVLIGQQGNECIKATDLARLINTHPYEILTSLGSRAVHVYS